MIIGLTGCMASGKSTVSIMLKKRGFHIIDADMIGHNILDNAEIKAKLTRRFGSDILGSDGKILRKRLAEKAFSSENAAAELNTITHPAIIGAITKEAAEYESAFPAVVIDAPLLIETGLHKFCGEVWLVCSNIETRYARIMKRDCLTRARARERIAKQIPQWRKKRFADKIIENDGTTAELEEKIERLTADLLREKQKSSADNP